MSGGSYQLTVGPCLSQVWSPPLGGWGWAQESAGLLAGGEGGIDVLLDPGLLLTPWWVGCILSLLVDRLGPGVAEGSEGPLAAGLLVGRTGSPQLLFGLECSRPGACGLVGGLGPDTSKLEENS